MSIEPFKASLPVFKLLKIGDVIADPEAEVIHIEGDPEKIDGRGVGAGADHIPEIGRGN